MLQLANALNDAEEANKAKQEFFSKMSHDIRTPLNVVLGMTQIAQKYKNDAPRLESALDSITNEGNYLLVLINSILDVNQLEHGHMELNKAPFDAVRCAADSVELLRPLADKKAQTMALHCDKPDCVVVGDVNRYSQIMINIISNAIKYTPVGGEITVRLDCLPGGRVIFRCTDTGIGMTPEFIGHITEDYVRAEDSRVSKVQGTGLGMSVVKGFTDLMGGTLDMYSHEGHGSTFVVSIPFAEADDAQRAAVLAPHNVLDCPAGADAMIYPFLCRVDGLRGRLIKNKVYVSQWWKYLLELLPADSVEADYSRYLLPLPIDQRYTPDDMRALAALVLQLKEEGEPA